MNDFFFLGMNLKKENQISTSLRKWIGRELIFHFIHYLFHIFTHLCKRGKNHLTIGGAEICSFSTD